MSLYRYIWLTKWLLKITKVSLGAPWKFGFKPEPRTRALARPAATTWSGAPSKNCSRGGRKYATIFLARGKSQKQTVEYGVEDFDESQELVERFGYLVPENFINRSEDFVESDSSDHLDRTTLECDLDSNNESNVQSDPEIENKNDIESYLESCPESDSETDLEGPTESSLESNTQIESDEEAEIYIDDPRTDPDSFQNDHQSENYEEDDCDVNNSGDNDSDDYDSYDDYDDYDDHDDYDDYDDYNDYDEHPDYY